MMELLESILSGLVNASKFKTSSGAFHWFSSFIFLFLFQIFFSVAALSDYLMICVDRFIAFIALQGSEGRGPRRKSAYSGATDFPRIYLLIFYPAPSMNGVFLSLYIYRGRFKLGSLKKSKLDQVMKSCQAKSSF